MIVILDIYMNVDYFGQSMVNCIKMDLTAKKSKMKHDMHDCENQLTYVPYDQYNCMHVDLRTRHHKGLFINDIL